MKKFDIRFAHLTSTIAIAAALATPAAAQSPKVGDPPEARDMRLVGMNDLQARSAYQPTIHKQGDRTIAYVGHHGGTPEVPKPLNPLTGQAEFNGTSIVDVTDPSKPKYPVPHSRPGGEFRSRRRADDPRLRRQRLAEGRPQRGLSAALVRRRRPRDLERGRSVEARAGLQAELESEGHPQELWECDTGIAYLVSGVEGWRSRRMTEVFDLSDPAKPVKIRDFGLVGQEPGTSGTVPTDLHGMISTGPQGNRIYFGYGTNKGGVVQIVDRDKLLKGPKEPTPDNLRYPIVRQIDLLPISGAHTTVPLLGVPVAEFAKDKDGKVRDFIMIVNEQILNECLEPRQMVYFMDVTVESRPMVVSNFNVPEASGNFCGRGGRFGSHSANESTAPVFHKKVAFFTWFNGGVRAVDIRDPYQPKEIGYFIPPITEATDKRCIKVDGKDRCKTAIQSNNLETDDRGYVYVVDRANTGMHVLELTGEARKVAGQR